MILVWLFLYSVSVSPWRGTAIYIAVFPPSPPTLKFYCSQYASIVCYLSPWLNKIKQDVFGHDRTQLPAITTLVLIFYIFATSSPPTPTLISSRSLLHCSQYSSIVCYWSSTSSLHLPPPTPTLISSRSLLHCSQYSSIVCYVSPWLHSCLNNTFLVMTRVQTHLVVLGPAWLLCICSSF
jgi:hypothetical protein